MRVCRRKLEIAMARRCLTSSELAEVAGIPRPTLNGAISGRGISPATLGKIANGLQVDVEELIEEGSLDDSAGSDS